MRFASRLYILTSEAFYAMKGAIIGIVVRVGIVERGAAKIEKILPLDLKVHVLKSHLFGIALAIIVKILHHLPVNQILGGDQGQQIAEFCFLGRAGAGSNGKIPLRNRVVFDHELGKSSGELHTPQVGQRRVVILEIHLIHEGVVVFSEAHDIQKPSLGVDRKSSLNGHNGNLAVLQLGGKAVDFDANTITINHTVVGGTRIIAKDDTKTYCSKRTYELLPEIKALLLQLREQQKDYKKRLGSGYHNNDYIFKNPNGMPYRPDSLTRSFKRALERHGLPQMRYHDIRHSTASILVDKGWDINDVKEWLGHSDISTTANIYAHISHRRKVSLAKSLEGSLTFEQSTETTV